MPLKKNQIIPLSIESLSSDGNGVGHFAGQAVFVPASVPTAFCPSAPPMVLAEDAHCATFPMKRSARQKPLSCRKPLPGSEDWIFRSNPSFLPLIRCVTGTRYSFPWAQTRMDIL